MLYLCDNQSSLKAVCWWICEGGKATMVGALAADTLKVAIETLRKTAGTATFLVKVKAHRGQPANMDPKASTGIRANHLRLF